MKEKILYALWACLYILCVGLGTVDNAEGAGKVLFTLTGLIFFIPGGVLTWFALRERNRRSLLALRIISICSLGLTLVFLVANFLAVNTSDAVGDVLYDILNIVSAPMFCSQYWILSMFLWACLMMATFTAAPKK